MRPISVGVAHTCRALVRRGGRPSLLRTRRLSARYLWEARLWCGICSGKAHTGRPNVVSTSCDRRGEPIVQTLENVFRFFVGQTNFKDQFEMDWAELDAR